MQGQFAVCGQSFQQSEFAVTLVCRSWATFISPSVGHRLALLFAAAAAAALRNIHDKFSVQCLQQCAITFVYITVEVDLTIRFCKCCQVHDQNWNGFRELHRLGHFALQYLVDRCAIPAGLPFQQDFGEFQRPLDADATGAESSLGLRKQGSAGRVMQVNQVFVGKHEFYLSHGILWARLLSQYVRKAFCSHCLPVYAARIDDLTIGR